MATLHSCSRLCPHVRCNHRHVLSPPSILPKSSYRCNPLLVPRNIDEVYPFHRTQPQVQSSSFWYTRCQYGRNSSTRRIACSAELALSRLSARMLGVARPDRWVLRLFDDRKHLRGGSPGLGSLEGLPICYGQLGTRPSHDAVDPGSFVLDRARL